jgi:tight adherence protein B
MDVPLLLVMVTGGAAATVLALQAYTQLTHNRRAVRARLAPRGSAQGAGPSPLRQTSGRSPLYPLASLLPFSQRSIGALKLELIQAGWQIRPEEFIVLRLIAAVIAAAGGAAVVGYLGIETVWLRIAIVAAMALGGWYAPRFVLSRKRQKRLETVEKQLPDALTAMAKSLRAGAGILHALEYAASETPAPLGPEMAAVMRDLQLGADPEEVFRGLSERVGSPDLDIASTGILIQRTVGGNLGEILSQVTDTVRERAEIQNEIRALTAQQRLGANMAAALPVLVAAAITLMRPEVGSLLITTPAGNIALAIGIACEVLGLWLIKRLAVIEV